MSFEVEQKFRTAGHHDTVMRLTAMGADATAPVEQVDAYLNHPCRDFATSGEALRIRRVGDRNAITYKGPKLAGPTKTRPEYEVAFAEGPRPLDALLQVLLALGFRPVAEIRKVRTPYQLTIQGRSLEVALDEVEGLGTFVEVETLAADQADLPAAQAAVVTLSRTLGLTEYEPRSYLRMVLERHAAAADR
jgi:adenylate cyclase, class 2